jgi:hypothetical protein
MGRELRAPDWNESERLAALHSFEILDTPPEPDFDDLVQLIAQICEAPRAAINLVGSERQWFKAEIGLGIRETPIRGLDLRSDPAATRPDHHPGCEEGIRGSRRTLW